MADQELCDRICVFARSLVEQLLNLKNDVDAEFEHLHETREPRAPFPRDPDIGLSCIESAAHEADWFEMIGLAAAVQKSISHRDSLSLEIWAGYEAERRSKDREKRRAAKRRRLERAAKASVASCDEPQSQDSAASCATPATTRD
jgi:hypothetical protein